MAQITVCDRCGAKADDGYGRVRTLILRHTYSEIESINKELCDGCFIEIRTVVSALFK